MSVPISVVVAMASPAAILSDALDPSVRLCKAADPLLRSASASASSLALLIGSSPASCHLRCRSLHAFKDLSRYFSGSSPVPLRESQTSGER